MDLQLDGKVALVSGGSRGIGRGIAEALAQEGCRVAVCARNAEPLEEAVEAIRARGGEAMGVPLDITSDTGPAAFVREAREAFGGIDVVVNNAGGNRRGRLEETTDEDWRDIFELNVHSGVRLVREALPSLREADSGAVVFIASLFGREAGGPGIAIYNSTKSAAISAARILALDLAEEGIRVNSVAPGSIRFPGGSWDRRVKENPEKMEKWVEANLPLGRFGTVEEVADVVTFLCSDRASLVTGACVPVDGSQGRSLM